MAGVLTAAIAAAFAGGVTPDPYFEYTTLLLPGNGTNGAQNNTFLDGSTNNFTITRNGNTTQGTFSPFSQTGWGNYFGGTDGFLTTATNSAFTFGTGDFTVEFWCYPISSTGPGGYAYLYAQGPNTTSALGIYFQSNTFRVWNGSTVITGTVSRSTNTWYHVALSRSSTSMKLFVNGVQDGSTATNSSNITTGSTYGATLGRWVEISDSNYFVGYLSSVRAVKGTAVYTSDFTPPTAPLTAISGTSLLTCQSNRFIDNSTNNFTITKNGDTRVVAFSPFNPTASWSAATYGGSGYFDGSGDYLSATGSAATQMGTGAFTWECWCYILGASAYQGFIDTRTSPSSGSATGMALFLNTGTLTPIVATTGTILTSSINVTANSWNHVALTRSSGGTLTIWVNGSSGGTVSNSSNLTDTSIWVGGNSSSPHPAYVNGYLSNVRMTKGADLYTTPFTPPTSPLTTTVSSGTVGLLLNFTNAGIYDATSKNDLETVGNAQISTTQSKWGGSSISFDGTGDWLLIPDQPPQRIGTGNFTVEMWVYRNSSGTYGLAGKGTGTTGWLVSLNSSNQVVFTYGSSTITSSGTVSATTWTHIAVVREGTSTNQTKIYISGTNDGTGTVSTDFNQTNSMYIGADRTGGSAANAYVQDVRITNYARYTGNFTPPTAAFPTL